MLHSVTSVLGQPTGPIFKGQAVFLRLFGPWRWCQ